MLALGVAAIVPVTAAAQTAQHSRELRFSGPSATQEACECLLEAGTAVRLRVGRVSAVDRTHRFISVATGNGTETLAYDTLVYALGSTIQRDAVPGVRSYAHALSGPEVAVMLGYAKVRAVRLPAGLVVRLPAGPALDPAAAKRPVDLD